MTVSYATNIRPLFTQTDIDRVVFSCDLAAYADLKPMLMIFLAVSRHRRADDAAGPAVVGGKHCPVPAMGRHRP